MVAQFADSSNLSSDEVFIVEDEQTSRRTLGRLLGSYGYRTRAFATAEQALQWLQEHNSHPRAALVDFNLPGMDGLELIARMEKLTPETLVVLVTAADEQTLSQRLPQRPLPYLRKPLDFGSLLDVLSENPSTN